MFGGVGVRVVAGQSLGVSADALLLMVLLLHELRRGGREERHVVHGAHGVHLGGDEGGGGERAVASHRLPLEGAIEVFQEVRLQRQRDRPR